MARRKRGNSKGQSSSSGASTSTTSPKDAMSLASLEEELSKIVRQEETSRRDRGIDSKELDAHLSRIRSGVSSFVLNPNGLSSEQSRSIFDSLRDARSRIIQLLVMDTIENDVFLEHLSAFLAEPNCRLQDLILRESKIGDDGIQRLKKGLMNSQSLLKLMLDSCSLSSVGTKFVIDCFLSNPNSKLEFLSIGGNELNDDFFSLLEKYVSNERSPLRNLVFSGTKSFSNRGNLVAKILSSHKCLHRIVLRSCGLNDKDVLELFQAILRNPNHCIDELDISGNAFSRRCLQDGKEVLTNEGFRLKRISFKDVFLGDEGGYDLAEIMQTNKYLSSINIQCTGIKKAVARGIMDTVQYNTGSSFQELVTDEGTWNIADHIPLPGLTSSFEVPSRFGQVSYRIQDPFGTSQTWIGYVQSDDTVFLPSSPRGSVLDRVFESPATFVSTVEEIYSSRYSSR